MGIFGWSYPPGAAGDPYAPYNMEEQPSNDTVEEAFADYDSPGEVYRVTYKYTGCGPSVGFQITNVDGKARWVYCDSLYPLGTWADLRKRGDLITGICVGSIVEGVDFDADTVYIDVNPLDFDTTPEQLKAKFDAAVEEVNADANSIWNSTHGCETCAKHWHDEGIDEGEWGPFEGCDGITPVWNDCPDCQGGGAII